MSELNALTDLQKTITQTRERGEKILRGFWQFTLIFGTLGFLWILFYPKTHPNEGVEKLPFMVIGGFGLLVIAVWVIGDALFFNKAYDWEEELETRQSALAAHTLEVDEKRVKLRYRARNHLYELTIAMERNPFVAEDISLETKMFSLTFHLVAASLKEVILLLTRYKDEITRN